MRYKFENGTLTISGKEVKVPNVKFIEVIGWGANAVVLEGFNKIVQRQVAVKVWLPRYNYQYPDKKRFLAEIRKISQFNNGKIVQIYNAGIDRNNNYYAEMEYVHGQTIEEWLKVDRPLYLRCMILAKILDGIEDAHNKGLYHGDLHAENIMIDNEDEIKILDFGTSIFARTIEDSHRREGIKLLETGLKMIKEEVEKYKILDIDPEKCPPECVRDSLDSLKEIINRIESIDVDIDRYGKMDTVLSIFSNVINAPFFKIDLIAGHLFQNGFSNDVVGLLYRQIYDECINKLTGKKADYIYSKAVSDEFINRTYEVLKKWRFEYMKQYNSLLFD